MDRLRWRTVTAAIGLAGTLLVTPAGLAAAGPAPAGRASAVFVEFDRPSALQSYEQRRGQGAALAREAAREARSQIADATDELLADFFRGSEDTSEIFRTTNAVAGVAVEATPRVVREIAARPGVRSVRRITPARVSNADGDRLGRAVNAWQQTGRLGRGVRIGIIDTGIDYTHADFGGPGTVAAFTAVDPARVDPSVFPTAKVVGGVDLAGDAYDADASDPARTIPVPDANPIDCEGHGSHVAGTAAGYGETADGATFRGDYSQLSPADLDAMRIGPGAAPAASLYAIRVFGCSGSTELTALGLDRALDPDDDGDFSDRLDVVNLSLGTSFAAVDDPVNDFVHVLTQHGVLVVAAAGNSGDLYDAGGSPGNSPEALAVASVRDAGALLDGIGGPAGPLAGQYSEDYARYDTLDVTAPVVDVGVDGCAPLDPARVRGKIAWLEWADDAAARACGSASRADHARAAGAVGVLLTSGLADFGPVRIAGDADIPVFQLTGPATAALRPLLGSVTVRLAGALRKTQTVRSPQIEDTISDFSARGSRGPTVKPDVAAPGESITSVESGSGDDRVSDSGTSMASPFVAGVAALVREAHPGWGPAEVKTAIMNTATADVYTGENRTGPRLPPMRVGAGRIDAAAALTTPALAGDAADPGAVSVTFGPLEVPPGRPLVRRHRVRVRDTGGAPASFDVTYDAATRTPGVRIGVSPSRVTVAPGRDAVVEVGVTVDDPAALRRTADPTLALQQAGHARDYLADASGRVVLTGGGRSLRVPVSVSPRPVSVLTATATATGVTLHGTAVDQGAGREAYRSRVGVFALAATSPELPVCAAQDAASGCVANGTGRGGDLRYVGLASAAGMLGIAITTWADLPSIGSTTVPEARIDVNGDGRPDFATTLAPVPDTDDLVATTVDLHVLPPRTVDVEPVNGFDGATDTGVFDTDAWVLPVRLAALGIGAKTPSAPLDVHVVVRGEYGPPAGTTGIVDEMAGSARFDPLAPAAVGAATLLVPADDGTAVPAAGPLLVVIGQNGSGHRVTVLRATPAPAHASTAPGAARPQGGAGNVPGPGGPVAAPEARPTPVASG